MTAFRDDIARTIVRSFYAMQGGDPADLADEDISPNSGDRQLAYDILAMPEMQAIKVALLWWMIDEGDLEVVLRTAGIYPSVIEWVMS